MAPIRKTEKEKQKHVFFFLKQWHFLFSKMVLADSSLVEPRSPQVAVNMAGRLMHPSLQGKNMTLNEEKFWMQMNPTLTDEDDEEYMLIDARKTHPLNHVRSEESEPFDVAKPIRYSCLLYTSPSPRD